MHLFNVVPSILTDLDTDIPSSGFDMSQVYGSSDAGPSYSNIHRGDSAGSYLSGADQYYHFDDSSGNVPGPSNVNRRPTSVLHEIANYSERGPLALHSENDDDAYWEDEEEDDDTRFVNFSLLSHIAVQLRDKVPRGTHVKGSIPYPRAFTGKDIVVRMIGLVILISLVIILCSRLSKHKSNVN